MLAARRACRLGGLLAANLVRLGGVGACRQELPVGILSPPSRRAERIEVSIDLLRGQPLQKLLRGNEVLDVLIHLDFIRRAGRRGRPPLGVPDERHFQLEDAVGRASPDLVVLGSKIEAARLERLRDGFEPGILEDAAKDLAVVRLILASQRPDLLHRQPELLGGGVPRGAPRAELGNPHQDFPGLLNFPFSLFFFVVVVIGCVPRDECLKLRDTRVEVAGDDVPGHSQRDHLEDLLGELGVV